MADTRVIFQEAHFFTTTLFLSSLPPPPPPILVPIIIEPSNSMSHSLNPNAHPFYPQQLQYYSCHGHGGSVPEKKRNSHFQGKFPRAKVVSKKYSYNTAAIPFPNTIEKAKASNFTTVMIRNIPNQFGFEELLQRLDEHCLEQNKNAGDADEWSKFDFVYLPMDYRRHAVENKRSNLGYAFVNFTTPSAAFKLYKQFHGRKWNVTENSKICEINVANHQGRERLIRIFSKKVFRCNSLDFLPVLFEEGRDGLNLLPKGRHIGKHECGLPLSGRRRIMGNRDYGRMGPSFIWKKKDNGAFHNHSNQLASSLDSLD